MGWMPRRVRGHPDAMEEYLVPHEGVTPWLRGPLKSWARSNFRGDGEDLERVRYFASLHRVQGFSDPDFASGAIGALFKLCSSDDELLLDLVDFQLGFPGLFPDQNRSQLGTHFSVAGSVFQVGGEDGSFFLERRVSADEKHAFELASEGDGTAAHHLTEAWRAAFSRSPDPKTAYSDALRAVEAAISPLVIPNDGSATLGKVISALRDALETPPIEVRITPLSRKGDPVNAVGVVTGLLQLLHQGQEGRHGTEGSGPPPENTLPETQDAVMIAVLLVNLCRTGGIARRATA